MAAFLTLAPLRATPARESPAADTPSWAPGVQALLDQRAAAVRAGNRQAFLDTLDPQATDAFRGEQATLFDGLHSLPLASYRLELRTQDVTDLSRAVAGTRGADELRLPAVEEHLRIRGVDATDAIGDQWLTFVRRGSHWYVNADDDVADLGLVTHTDLWAFGPVTLTQGEHLAVVSAPGQVERAQSLLDMAGEAYARLLKSTSWAPPPKILLVLPASVDQLQEMLQTNFDLTNFVAFATSDVDRSKAVGGWQWTAPRVYAQETNLSRHSRDFQVETLHHEFVHVVSFTHAGPFIPNWLHEGQAEWQALGHPSSEHVAGSDGKLPLDYQFVTGGSDAILRAYKESTSAVAFLAQRRGDDAPARLFDEVGSQRIVPGTWRYHVDQALRDVYGKGYDAFEHDWNGGGG